MDIRCIKQVKDGSEVYFEENVVYETWVGMSGVRYQLFTIDETEQEHIVAECENHLWENDNWFDEHFRIT